MGAQRRDAYNNAYSGFAGDRHPALLGSHVRDGWGEVASFNDNVFKVVLHGNQPLPYKDKELVVHLDPGMHVLTKPFSMNILASRVRD